MKILCPEESFRKCFSLLQIVSEQKPLKEKRALLQKHIAFLVKIAQDLVLEACCPNWANDCLNKNLFPAASAPQWQHLARGRQEAKRRLAFVCVPASVNPSAHNSAVTPMEDKHLRGSTETAGIGGGGIATSFGCILRQVRLFYWMEMGMQILAWQLTPWDERGHPTGDCKTNFLSKEERTRTRSYFYRFVVALLHSLQHSKMVTLMDSKTSSFSSYESFSSGLLPRLHSFPVAMAWKQDQGHKDKIHFNNQVCLWTEEVRLRHGWRWVRNYQRGGLIRERL